MSQANADDLLKAFEKLHIDLGDLNPQVIKAWFDTDCEKTKSLLTWLSSLTEENYLSPTEQSM